MRKNKLFTALAAVALLTGSGVGLVSSNQNVTTVQAATKGKKSTKKTTKLAKIRVKNRTVLYQIKSNKHGEITGIVPLRVKGNKQALRAGIYHAIWSINYKGTKYYYIGNNGNQLWAVRTKDAKIVGKKKAPNVNSFVKARQQKTINKRRALAKSWQNKVDAAQPKTFSAKVSSETTYWNVDSKGKPEATTDKLPMGTNLTILYKLPGVLKAGDQPVDAYVARDNDANKGIVVPANAVSLDNGSASDVLTEQQYTDANKNAASIYAQAKKALGIK